MLVQAIQSSMASWRGVSYRGRPWIYLDLASTNPWNASQGRVYWMWSSLFLPRLPLTLMCVQLGRLYYNTPGNDHNACIWMKLDRIKCNSTPLAEKDMRVRRGAAYGQLCMHAVEKKRDLLWTWLGFFSVCFFRNILETDNKTDIPRFFLNHLDFTSLLALWVHVRGCTRF